MEEDFKKPILPGPQKKPEEKTTEEKKVLVECPYNIPVKKFEISKKYEILIYLFHSRNGQDRLHPLNITSRC